MIKPKTVALVLPCFNEEIAIASVVHEGICALKDTGLEYEVIVVDNASTDLTVARAKNAGARIVHCAQQGYGAALNAGIQSAVADLVVWADGDGSYGFSELSAMLSMLMGGADFVIGNRFNSVSPQPRAMPFLNQYVGNPFLSWVCRVLFSSSVNDCHSGLRATRKDTYPSIKANHKDFRAATEQVIRAIRSGLVIKEVDISLSRTPAGRKSKLLPFVDGWKCLVMMLSEAWGQAPEKLNAD